MHTTVNLGKGTLYDVIFCNSAYLLHLLYSVIVYALYIYVVGIHTIALVMF